MGSFTEKISLIIDAKTDGATTALGKFRTEVAAADGFTGKFKAGVKSLGTGLVDFVKSPVGAATAVAAVGAAMFKAAGDAAELGVKIGGLADATGLLPEDASRWVEVAGDLGIGADTMAGLIEKMTLNLGKAPEKFAQFGIDIKTAKDGTVDMNATLMGAITTISAIENPTKKAEVAAALFGKGWAAASELVGMKAGEVKKRLDDVADIKVFDQDKVDDARDFRDVMDKLKDAGEELFLKVGQDLMPVLAKLVPIIANVVGAVEPLIDVFGRALGPVETLSEGIDKIDWSKPFASGGDLDKGIAKVREIEAAAKAAGISIEEQLNKSVDDLTIAAIPAGEAGHDLHDALTEVDSAAVRTSGATRRAKEAFEGAATAANAMDRELSELKGEIDDDQAWLDMLDTLDDYKAKMKDGEASDRDKVRSGLAVKEELIGRLEAIKNLPAQKQTEILTLIEQGEYDKALWAIGVLTAERKVKINFDVGNMPSLPGSKYASGTSSAAPGVALVGEQGPELVLMNGGERVIPAGQTAALAGGLAGGSVGGNTYNFTIVGTNMSGDEIIAAAKKYERRNGPGWRT